MMKQELISNAGGAWEVLDRAGNNLLLRRVKDGEYAIAHGWRGEGKGWDQGKYFGTDEESAGRKARIVFEGYKLPGSYGYR
ncbi:MAG: hypothetical protein A4E56_01442 [Pelotomaculum sp. PtaU1.Bin065]|nr:MAG: hypothetical protein A4E56_01442 [Pelotomaculum sp. PtaU1.Bin065]